MRMGIVFGVINGYGKFWQVSRNDHTKQGSEVISCVLSNEAR